MINVIDTEIAGVKIIEPKLFGDARGYFFESFSQREFEEKVFKTVFVQDMSKDKKTISKDIVHGLLNNSNFNNIYPQNKNNSQEGMGDFVIE